LVGDAILGIYKIVLELKNIYIRFITFEILLPDRLTKECYTDIVANQILDISHFVYNLVMS